MKTVFSFIVEVGKWLVETIMFNLGSIMKLLFIVGTAALVELLAIPYAEMERGYKAFGGEYFLFPLILIVGYLMLFKVPEKFEWFK